MSMVGWNIEEKEKPVRKGKETAFVINTIARPLKRELEDSSDEEPDGSFDPALFDYKGAEPPFKKAKFSTRKPEFKKITKVPEKYQGYESTFQEDFLGKIASGGFEKADQGYRKSRIKASIGLNRMESISSRKNAELYIELGADFVSDIRYETKGFFWKCKWLGPDNKKVDFKVVRKFYKQLKYKNPEKAKEFLKITESGVLIPYQSIREYLKNHESTKELTREFREEMDDPNIYMSFVDGDTINFNGIYSAYMRISSQYNPDCASTGYIFPRDKIMGDSYQLASLIDRDIRILTNAIIEGGTYFPEPNFIVRIPEDHDTIPESFIDTKIKKQNAESAALIRKVKDREGASFHFSSDNPIVTTIMDRARFTKNNKGNPMTFSKHLKEGACPDARDFGMLKLISQSHFNEKVWYDNLFINNMIKIEGSTKPHCIGLLAKLRNPEGEQDKKDAISELEQYIDPSIVKKIIHAAEVISKYVDTVKAKYIRSENQEKLIEILREDFSMEASDFPRFALIMLSDIKVLNAIGDSIIIPSDISKAIEDGASEKDLEVIFYEERIISLILKEEIDINDLFKVRDNVQDFTFIINSMLELYAKSDADFSKILEVYVDAIEYGENLKDLHLYMDPRIFVATGEADFDMEELFEVYSLSKKFGKKYISMICNMHDENEALLHIPQLLSIFNISYNHMLEDDNAKDMDPGQYFDNFANYLPFIAIEHDIESFIESYSENSIHLYFRGQEAIGSMGCDSTDLAIHNYNDEEIIKNAINQYDVEVEDIVAALEGEKLETFIGIITNLVEWREIDKSNYIHIAKHNYDDELIIQNAICDYDIEVEDIRRSLEGSKLEAFNKVIRELVQSDQIDDPDYDSDMNEGRELDYLAGRGSIWERDYDSSDE